MGFLALAASISCSLPLDGKHFDIAEFNRNRELWISRKVLNYTMLIGALGVTKSYSEQVRIEVREGKRVSTELLWDSGGGAVDATRPFETIEGLFEFIAEQNRRAPIKLEVRYDGDLGFPTTVEVDQDGQRKTGDEITVRIKKLEVTDPGRSLGAASQTPPASKGVSLRDAPDR